MKQRGFANIVLVLVIVVIAGTVGYFALVKKPNTPAIDQQVNPVRVQPMSPKTDDEVRNWTGFKSDFGFDLKYPANEVTFRPTCDDGMYAPATPTPAEKCESLMFSPKGIDYPTGPPPKSAYLFLVAHNNKDNLSIKNFVQQWLKSTSHPYQGELAKEVVAGHEAYTFTYVGKGYALLDYTEKQKWVFVKFGSSKVLSIENNFSVSNTMLSTFEKIISTVSFKD